MRQYARIKAQHRDAILLFRLGDFYEMFYDDAETASRTLGLALTSRSKGPRAVPLAGIPHHAAGRYIARLLEAGHKVAICDQVEDPRKAGGLVRREVTRVITPGTLIDESLLDDRENNYLAAVAPAGERVGLAYADLSTGEFRLEELARADLPDELARISPAECLYPHGVSEDEPPPYGKNAAYHGWAFESESARKRLLEHLGVTTLSGFGCEDMTLAQAAAGAIVAYLEETQKTSLDHLRRLAPVRASDYMLIDESTARNLELLAATSTGERKASLLGVLDRTRTTMGARLLKQWVVRPLVHVVAIVERLDAVEEMLKDPGRRAAAAKALAGISDVERICAKVATGRANARDMLSLKASLLSAAALARDLDGARAKALTQIRGECTSASGGAAAEVVAMITSRVHPEPPATISDGGVIADGFNAEVDRLRDIRSGGRQWMAEFQAREAERTGIQSLKVGYNRVFGYYIEVTKANLERVPADYVRKQTLVGAERFVTPELKERESEILRAEERIKELEYKLFTQLRDEVAQRLSQLQVLAHALAELDCYVALADVARANAYVRPDVDESQVLDIKDGRHPVIEEALSPGEFVPNDLLLDGSSRQIVIVTGPNMAGKSTYIRQGALIAAMAQMGSFVPAARARVGVVDRLFARVGASDDIRSGRSTFMVEMTETANILNNCTERSLIILDEVGRGTSTFDGVSIAWAVTEHLHSSARSRPRTLFATHYHELTEIASSCPRVANCSVAVREWGDEVVFLHKVVPGGADRSYGIYVAKLAGIPREVIERAKDILAALEGRAMGMEEKVTPSTKEVQLPLFAPVPHAVLRELAHLDVDRLTPLEALARLDQLKKLAQEER